MKRRGFTIIELIMVMGIIAVLLGIVVSTTAGAVREARQNRSKAMCAIIQQGIATYYAQKDEWPVKPGTPSGDNENYTYNTSETHKMIRTVVEQTKKNNPMIDVSGLFVSRQDGEPGSQNVGMDFWTAVKGTKKNPKKMKLSEMNFGYPLKKNGLFRRFVISYSPANDMVTVRLQTDAEENARRISDD